MFPLLRFSTGVYTSSNFSFKHKICVPVLKHGGDNGAIYT